MQRPKIPLKSAIAAVLKYVIGKDGSEGRIQTD